MSETEPTETDVEQTRNQCIAETRNGVRCTRSTVEDTNYCYQHDEDNSVHESVSLENDGEVNEDDEEEDDDPAFEPPSILERAAEENKPLEEKDLKEGEFDPNDFGRKSWKFEFKGYLVEGSDPEDDDPAENRGEDEMELSADDKVARLVAPTTRGELLFWRAIQHLHDSPEISRELWIETFSPKDRMLLASRHLEEFGIDDFRDDMDAEETAELMEAGEEIESAKLRGELPEGDNAE